MGVRDDNVGPLLLLGRQLRDSVVVGIGAQQQRRDDVVVLAADDDRAGRAP
jgi:hypothetical protein